MFSDYIKKRMEKNNIDRDVISAFTSQDCTRNIILNFSSKDSPHGCKFSCSFCNWKHLKKSLVPRNEDIDRFLEGFKGYKVILSGGGDPLFEYERNKSELKRIIDHIHKKGFLVEVITREFDAIKENLVELKNLVDLWSFSIENVDEKYKSIMKLIGDRESIRISKILSNDPKIPEYIDYYSGCVFSIIFRENLNSIGEQNFQEFMKSINDFLTSEYSKIFYVPADVCSNNFFLQGNKILFSDTEISVGDGNPLDYLVPKVLEVIPEGLMEVMKETNSHIAGGMLRDLLIKKEFKDIDIFCVNQVKFEDLINFFKSSKRFKKLEKNPKRKRINLESFIDLETSITYDLINYHYAFNDEDYIVETFDFTMNALMLNSHTGSIVSGPSMDIKDVVRDIVGKRLIFLNKVIFKPSFMRAIHRWGKFIMKGYKPTKESFDEYYQYLLDLHKIMMISDLTDDVKEVIRNTLTHARLFHHISKIKEKMVEYNMMEKDFCVFGSAVFTRDFNDIDIASPDIDLIGMISKEFDSDIIHLHYVPDDNIFKNFEDYQSFYSNCCIINRDFQIIKSKDFNPKSRVINKKSFKFFNLKKKIKEQENIGAREK